MAQKELNRPSSYWDKRRLARYSQNEKETKKYIKKIQKIYSRSNKEVNEMLDSVYRNYAKDTGLDIQKLKTLLTKSQTKKTFDELKKQGLDQYVKENYKARISHLEQIQAQIYSKAKEIYPEEKALQEMAYKGVVNSNYYKTIYDIEQNTGFMYNFSRIDDNMLNAVLSERWSGKNFSERIWVNTDILADSLSEIIGSSLISGQGVEKTARDIRERFKVGKYYSERLVRTEMNYFDNQADMMAYEELGIEEYVLVATLDMKTSPYCIEIDGKHFPYDKIEVGKNYPPFHPNCRCTTRGYLGKDAEKMMDRVAINPDTGKRETIPNMSYKEWYNKYVKLSASATGDSIKYKDTTINKIGKIDPKDTKSINKLFEDFDNKMINKKIEHSLLIDNKGTIYHLKGYANGIDYPSYLLKDSIGIHNHPEEYTRNSFSWKDFDLFLRGKMKQYDGFDKDYTYSLKRTNKTNYNVKAEEIHNLSSDIYHNEFMDLLYSEKTTYEEEFHYIANRISEMYNIKYERKPRK